MFVKPLKERFGFVLVIAGAGLGTALITGSDLVAAVIAVGAGCVFLAAMAKRPGSESAQGGDSTRQKGSPFTYLFAWELSGKPEFGQMVQLLAGLGLKPQAATDSGEKLVFQGGSQTRTRLFGGYFVAPRNLPIRATLGTVSAQRAQMRLELEIQDTLKVAIRDGALEERYLKAAADIRTAVEKGLKEQNLSPVHGAKPAS